MAAFHEPLAKPRTVMGKVPVAAAAPADRLSVLVPALIVRALNDAVTPLGKPVTARVTMLLNPLPGVTRIGPELLEPGATNRLGAAEIVNGATTLK